MRYVYVRKFASIHFYFVNFYHLVPASNFLKTFYCIVVRLVSSAVRRSCLVLLLLLLLFYFYPRYSVPKGI